MFRKPCSKVHFWRIIFFIGILKKSHLSTLSESLVRGQNAGNRYLAYRSIAWADGDGKAGEIAAAVSV